MDPKFIVYWALLVATLGCRPEPAGDVSREVTREVSATGSAKTELAVAAAANLQFVFPELESAFEAGFPDIDVVPTYGSSGNFFSQLSARAPFDIFLSADTQYPQQLVENDLADAESRFLYAQGRIVLWVRNESPLELERLGIQAVASEAVRKLAIANPRLAPYGVAAESALQAAGVYEKVEDRLVLGENVTQTAHFVATGAADAGIIAMSVALAPQMAQAGRYWEIPPESYDPIQQAGAIPNWSRNREAAEALRDFLVSERGQAIFARFGYGPPRQ